ncbi:MAG: N-formylglutamate amidohydrolase [Rhodospirillaceae bacterium]|nr:N-formylglutamate amidohydrolase [Rhodospirillaceae bacterium]
MADTFSAKPVNAGSQKPLLRESDPPAFEIYNPSGPASLLIISDHASNVVPARLGDLGLSAENFSKHIAYDIGADMITRFLADKIKAPAVISNYSRLVIDTNRQPGDPQSIPEISDRIKIPGNANLDQLATQARMDEIFAPYHDTIDSEITRLWNRDGKPPALFSIHSFTPQINGENRFWDIGVLWNRDPRMALPLIENLKNWPGLHVGDNEPYSGRDLAYSIDRHGGAGGIANCAIEIRQDHCAYPDEASHWADILADALSHILSLPALHTVASY